MNRLNRKEVSIQVEEVRAEIFARKSTDKLEQFVSQRGSTPRSWEVLDSLYGYACFCGNIPAMQVLVKGGATNVSWSNLNGLSSEVFAQSYRVREQIDNGDEDIQ